VNEEVLAHWGAVAPKVKSKDLKYLQTFRYGLISVRVDNDIKFQFTVQVIDEISQTQLELVVFIYLV
jgi:biopolymer transport protein ExbD